MITMYFVCKGHTLAAHGHGARNLMNKSFGEDTRVPQEYIDSLEEIQPGRLAELVKIGVLRKVTAEDPAPAAPKRFRVAAGHHLSHRVYGVEPIRAGEKVPDEVLAELGPGRVKQLVENGTLTEHELSEIDEEEEGGIA